MSARQSSSGFGCLVLIAAAVVLALAAWATGALDVVTEVLQDYGLMVAEQEGMP